MNDDGDAGRRARRAARQYLRSVAAQQQPFFLVVSLVNPHDVLVYPNSYARTAATTTPGCEGDIELPPPSTRTSPPSRACRRSS